MDHVHNTCLVCKEIFHDSGNRKKALLKSIKMPNVASLLSIFCNMICFCNELADSGDFSFLKPKYGY